MDVYYFIKDMGINIKGFNDLSIQQKFSVTMYGAKGLFCIDDVNSVYMFDSCEEEDVDYVLAHELSHLLSCREGGHLFELNNKLKVGETISDENKKLRWQLVHLEECQADMFAYIMCGALGIQVPDWVSHIRMLNHRLSLSEEHMQQCEDSAKQLFIRHVKPILISKGECA